MVYVCIPLRQTSIEGKRKRLWMVLRGCWARNLEKAPDILISSDSQRTWKFAVLIGSILVLQHRDNNALKLRELNYWGTYTANVQAKYLDTSTSFNALFNINSSTQLKFWIESYRYPHSRCSHAGDQYWYFALLWYSWLLIVYWYLQHRHYALLPLKFWK